MVRPCEAIIGRQTLENDMELKAIRRLVGKPRICWMDQVRTDTERRGNSWIAVTGGETGPETALTRGAQDKNSYHSRND
jgi:hypothetical protein